MSARRFFSFFLLALLALLVWAGWWVTDWLHRGPIETSGGLYFPSRMVLPGPLFLQNDPQWKDQTLAATPSTIGGEGCAVSSAAMVLSGYGVATDPARLNEFLIKTPGGYTPEGWIYWEKAAEFDPALTSRLLPHYEDLPSHALIDQNLLQGNPVIARIRYPSGITHFVAITGKDGFDYLIRDPGQKGEKGIYPMRELSDRIEALRFYRKP